MIDWLLHTLAATSGLILLVLLVREPVRRRFGSRIAYGLWLIPAARLFMPTLTTTIERGVPAGQTYPLFRPVAGEPLLLANVAAPEPSLFARIGGLPTALVAGWLAVALALFLSRMIAFHRDRRAILASSDELARVGSVRIIRSPEVLSPVAFGILDRVIAVPADFHSLYVARERRLALEHELAHHRSGDLIANLFAFVLLCLQWFNPLAWVAHAAFRFDQEAACDARVLDKAAAGDRAEYGRAIAKAASGRALLFVSVLDRRNSLHRRLQSMLRNPNPNRRPAGRLLVGAAILIAMPLTAGKAVRYVDVPQAAPAAAATPARAAPTVPSAAAVAWKAAAVSAAAPAASPEPTAVPGGVTLGKGDIAFLENDNVIIDGKVKRLDQLTPAQRHQLRNAIAKSSLELQRESAELPARLAEARQEIDRLKSGAYQRQIIEARADLQKDLAEIDSIAGELRAAGEDPEKRKAEIREALRESEAIDIDKTIGEKLVDLDPDKIAAELRQSVEQMQRLQARLEQLDRANGN